jgi:hypothetical protein
MMSASATATAPLYALDDPANYVDPSGRPVFLVVLLIGSLVGAILGAVGAAANRVKTWDEFLLWVIGGVIGGVLAVLGWTGIIGGVWALFELDASVDTTATIGLIIFGTAGLFRGRGRSAAGQHGPPGGVVV